MFDWLLGLGDFYLCKCGERFWRWVRDIDPERDELRERGRYVPPLPTTTIKSLTQREATRRKMRERVADRRRRDER